MDNIATDFAKAATQYDAHAHVQREVGERLLSRLDYMQLAPRTILDIGCGTGGLLQALEKRYPQAQVVGLDIALPMCKQVPGQVVCADMHTLPFRPHSIDLVVSNFSLQWSADLPVVFSEIARVAAPEAVFLFATVGAGSLVELTESWAQVDTQPRVHPFMDMHSLGDSLYQAGWQEPVVDRDLLMRYYPTVEDILTEFKQLGVTNKDKHRLRGLTGKHRFGKFVSAYEALRVADGVPVSWQVLYGYARASAGIQLR